MFRINLEAITKNGLQEKIVETITKLGKPDEIRYGTRRGEITVWETATLIYEKEQTDVN